jgi:hypothetical protein
MNFRRAKFPLPDKVRTGVPVKAAWANALLDCVAQLRKDQAASRLQPSADIGITESAGGVMLWPKRRGGSSVKGCRFRTTFNRKTQRLHVGDGSVLASDADEIHQSSKTITPTLDGTSIAQNPSWDVSDKESGKLYNVWCVIDRDYNAHMQLVADDEEVDFSSGWMENAACIASITWQSDDNGLFIENPEDLIQHWWSDLPWFWSALAGSSSGDSSSGDSSDSDGDSNNSDSSSGSDDGSSAENSCDPQVEITSVVCVLESVANGTDTANCFFNASTQEDLRIGVEVTVTGNPCHCRNSWVKVTAGGTVLGSRYMGFGGTGSVTIEGVIPAYACAEIPITACWFTPSVGVDTDDPCIGLSACAETTITAPPVCGDATCSEDSSDDSSGDDSSSSADPGSGSDDSDSDSDSDSEDSSDKNCIVPMLDGGHAALACIESPNTWFFDIVPVAITGRITRIPIDPKFDFVCEPETLRAIACEGGTAVAFARIEGGELIITCGMWRRPREAVVTIAGIRKGSTHRFPARTEAQYEKSRNFWRNLNR